MSGSQPIDKRSAPRRSYHRSVGVLFKGEYRLMRGFDLSESGMAFRSSLQIGIKSRVVISLTLPDGGAVVARAEISTVRKLEGGMFLCGVQFIGIGIQQRRLIRSYVIAKTEEEAAQEAEQVITEERKAFPEKASTRVLSRH